MEGRLSFSSRIVKNAYLEALDAILIVKNAYLEALDTILSVKNAYFEMHQYARFFLLIPSIGLFGKFACGG